MAPVTRMSQRTAARLVLAAAALGAGAIHLASADHHLQEWRPLGVSFVLAGAFQVLWAVAVVVRDSRPLLRAGGLASLLFLATWLVSRTTGLPVGPDAFTPEAVGTSDLLCCALEVPVALGALLLARSPRALGSALGRRWSLGLAGALLLVGSGSAAALASPEHHDHVACPPAPVFTGVVDDRGVDTGVTEYFRCRLLHSHDGAGHGGS